MNNWCPTDAGFELLEKTGLDKRIDKNWRKISELRPLTAIFEDYMLADRLNVDTPPARRKAIRDWVKKDVRMDTPDSFFMVSGTVTDALLTKAERKNIRKFGVEDISQMDGLLASYVQSKYWEKQEYSKTHYVWRSPGLKTEIYGNMHGDMQVSQLDTTPQINKNTIDSTEVVQLFGELARGHVNADYCFWPVLVATAIKYADTVGVEIPEVKNWQDLANKYRWSGEILDPWSNQGVGYDGFLLDYSSLIIPQMPDKLDIQKVKKLFFGRMSPNASHSTYYLPIIDLDQRLLLCCNHAGAKNKIEVGDCGGQMSYVPEIIIPKEDAHHLFKGAVHGIMTHQSRTCPEYLAFMFWQYDQLKAGKSKEAIREEGHRKFKGW